MAAGEIGRWTPSAAGHMAAADQVWFVEDDDDYALLLEVAAGRAGISHQRRFPDGTALLTHLSTLGTTANARDALPALFVLDVEMPGINGLDVLEHLRGGPATRDIPVVMLTSSIDPRHLSTAHKFGAAEYLVKPVGFAELLTLLAMMRGLWVRSANGAAGVSAGYGPSI